MTKDTQSARDRLVALQITKTALVGAAALAAAFLLVREAAPALMDMRSTALFVLGAACWPLAGLVLLWAGVWFSSDWRAFRDRLSRLDKERITYE